MSRAQDAVRCSLCSEVVVIHCKSCDVNLCGQCVKPHIDRNLSIKHEILPFTSELFDPEAEVQKCKDHPKQPCDLYCQDCNVPICSRCLTGNHKRHGAVDLEEICTTTRTMVKEDLEELKNFQKEYEKIVKSLKMKAQKYTEHCKQEKSSLQKIKQIWHETIDRSIQIIEKRLDGMLEEDMKCYQDNIEEIQRALERVTKSLKRNENLLRNDNSFTLLEYESEVEELRLVPARRDIKPPSLHPKDVQEEAVVQQLVSLESSVRSSLPGFTISKTGQVCTVSTMVLVEEHTLLATIKTECSKLKGIQCESKERVWVYGEDEKLRLLDKSGSMLNCVTAISRNSQKDIALNKDGEIAFSHKTEECIYLVRNNKMEKLFCTPGWIPYGVSFNVDGELMVCMRRNDHMESKVGIYREGNLKKEIQFDETGKPLFSASRNNMYITENGNSDICVSDWNACAVIVTKKDGEFRFRYTGNLSRSFKEFYPHGIDTDSYCRILVVDRDNHCVHVIDRNGKFLCFIACTLHDPFVLSVDSEENLWVGECDTGCIKVIKYLD